MDCIVALAPVRKRFAFVAGNDAVESPPAFTISPCQQADLSRTARSTMLQRM
jgi:hypothetical protein